ncbi:hypothetical protein IFM89_014089 [Coptis chinensis]|uniref:Uncharacterized protein n=1 Tax=Coptis chinensis TaxID=261450 RepID=A0A835GZ92_9MAGN|nr:hypothetical protein IFM89_014089 [Coptis chinensis]
MVWSVALDIGHDEGGFPVSRPGTLLRRSSNDWEGTEISETTRLKPNLRDLWNYVDWKSGDKKKKLAKEAINRSGGGLVEFSMKLFGNDEILHHIAKKTSSLKCIRFAMCGQLSDGLVELAGLLEEVDLRFSLYTNEAIEAVGCSCKHLKSVRLDGRGVKLPIGIDEEEFNKLAFGIGKNMPQVRRLEIFRNSLTENGLQGILDGCRELEYLDLRHCLCIMDDDLMKVCADKINVLRSPMDEDIGDFDWEERNFVYPLFPL